VPTSKLFATLGIRTTQPLTKEFEMKNPFSNETVKSAAIVIGSAAAFIALSKGVSILRKKFGGNAKVKAIFDSAENAGRGSKCLNEARSEQAKDTWARRNEPTDCCESDIGCSC
jgi:hypothetical protein